MQRPELNPAGVHFLGHGDDNDLLLLEAILVRQAQSPQSSAVDSTGASACAGAGTGSKRIVAVFTEFPSNPFLKSPDLTR